MKFPHFSTKQGTWNDNSVRVIALRILVPVMPLSKEGRRRRRRGSFVRSFTLALVGSSEALFSPTRPTLSPYHVFFSSSSENEAYFETRLEYQPGKKKRKNSSHQVDVLQLAWACVVWVIPPCNFDEMIFASVPNGTHHINPSSLLALMWEMWLGYSIKR